MITLSVGNSRPASFLRRARRRAALAALLVAAVVTSGALAAPPATARPGPAALAETSIAMTVDPATAPVGDHVTRPPLASLVLKVTGGAEPDGDVALVVDGEVAVTRKAQGTLLVKLPTTVLGQHTVVARYLGSPTQGTADSEPGTYTVTKADTRIIPSGDGEEVPLSQGISITVQAVGSTLVPAPPVEVSEDGAGLGEVVLESGAGSFPLADLSLGQHTLRFAYPGDERTNPSEATVTVTVVEGRVVFQPELQLDRATAVVGGEPITATVSVEQVEGPPSAPEGELQIFVDEELVSTHRGDELPLAVEIPVDRLGAHRVEATLGDTDDQEGGSVSRNYDVVKATTAFEVDTSHPYERTDTLRISVTSDGPTPPPGIVYLTGGRPTPSGYELFDLVDGHVDYPLDGLPVGPLRLEMYYDGDERNEGIIDRVVVTLVRSVGDTRVLVDVDRTDPIIDGPPSVVTASVVVEGGATPEGRLEFTRFGDDEPFAVRDAAAPATVLVPADRVSQGPEVTYVPTDPSQQPSSALAGYRVRAARTEPRVVIPSGRVSPGDVLPFSVAVLDASVAATGQVLVTDGEPSGCVWKDPTEHPYEPPTCANDLAVLTLDHGAGELTLPELDAGHHDLVFWYFPARDRPKSLPTTQRSQTTVTVHLSNGPGTVVELDRASAVVGGRPLLATASVDGTPDPEGEVEVFVDGESYERIAAGTSPVLVALPLGALGEHEVTARYTGIKSGAGPMSRPTTYSVTKATTTTTVTEPSGPVPPTGTLDVSVVANDSYVMPTGLVSVTEGTKTVAVLDPATGGWQLPLSRLSAGSHTLTFSYLGDHLTQASTVVASVIVSGPNGPRARARSTIRAAIDRARHGRLRIRATAASSVVLRGRVEVVQTAKRRSASGRLLSRSRVVAAAAITVPGKTVTVVMRTKRLWSGPSVISVRYLGSADVLASRRDYRRRG